MSKTAREMMIDGFGFDAGESAPGVVGRGTTAPGVDAMSAPGGEMRRLSGPCRPPGGLYVPDPRALRRESRPLNPQKGSLCAY